MPAAAEPDVRQSSARVTNGTLGRSLRFEDLVRTST